MLCPGVRRSDRKRKPALAKDGSLLEISASSKRQRKQVTETTFRRTRKALDIHAHQS